MEKEKYLRSKQYYIDLYDRYTVEECRRTEKHMTDKKELPPYQGKKFDKEQTIRIKKSFADLMLHFKTGERYLEKEKTIQKWMEDDQGKDDLYESAQAPEGIRCLTCRNLLKPTFKEFWSQLDKPDRVLFMYDCPNRCLPRRAFFDDGEEWRVKPDLCPECNTVLNQERVDNTEKLTTKSICPQCKYTKTDEYKWSFNKPEEIDENFAKDRDRFCLTDEAGKKYQEEKFSIERMAKFIEEWKEKDKARDEKLKANPRGFHLESAGYTCFICGQSTPEGDNWYDAWGIKCLVCQKAIDDGEISPNLAKEKDSWYSKFDIEYAFNVKGPTINKWIRQGILKARTVSHYGKGVHTQLFLLEDNKEFLPPKKLVEYQSASEVKDGRTWSHSEPWWKFVDPKKHLKGYKIMDYLKVIEYNSD